ncbi:general stress protein [Curtobacterium sp. MCBD17_021]|uniref:general stress protein n=1 Tax=Curtobacterium sp. MCBD17_021 TaxID=2175665 RepID=UPI0015E8A9EF|nr:general stress protein [Curtobacterium sp. MCBD17_021]
MSTQSPFGGRTAQAFPTLPRGDVLGTFDSYPEAQRVVAKLAEADFPVAKLSIVGNDLKTVERVTGKMTYGRAALAGALSGLWLGFFFGIVLTLFSPQAGGLFFAAAVIGAGFGMLYGIVSFAITKRQRDFTSIHQVLATTYQIVVDPQLSGQAQRILGQGGAIEHTSWDQPGGPGYRGQQQLGGPGQQQWGPGPGVPPQSAPPQYGQPGQQWRPGAAPQGSPYGGHATPHQPGGPGRPAGPDQQQGGDGAAPSAPGGQGPATPRYGTNDGPRYGTNDGAVRPAPTGDGPAHRPAAPRYGTNEGAARTPGSDGGAGADQAQRPSGSTRSYGTNDGPRYGEQAPTSAGGTGPAAEGDPATPDAGHRQDDGTDRRAGDDRRA